MSGAINWDTLAAWLALSAAATALFAWQYKADPQKARGWLGGSAICLELLAAGLAVHWALNNAEGAFCVLFIAGVIGLAVSKATLLPGIITASRRGQYGALAVGSIATIGAYLTVYLLGAMSGLENDSQRTAEALANSAPLQAIDAEIASTRERLAALAGFADASKAHGEEQAQASAAAASAAQRQELQAALSAARATLAGCNPTHKTRCINPANAEIARLESLLAGAGSVAPSGGYAARHSEYLGVQQHLTTLENRRAELLTIDSTAAAGLAVGVSERMIAWLTGLSEERARALKWLLLVAVFDLLSAAIRLFSEMMHGGEDAGQQAARRFSALLAGGLDPAQAAAHLAGNRQAADMPAYRFGGHVPADGPAVLHAGEYVMPPEAVNLHGLDKLEAMRAAALSATAFRLDGKPLEREAVKRQTVGVGATVRQCAHCGHDFTVTRKDRKYCGDECRAAAWEKRTGAKLRKGMR